MPVEIEFINNLSHDIELVATQNDHDMRVLANLRPGQQKLFPIPNGWAGNFKHTMGGRGSGPNGEGITLFEISVKTDDKNQIYYDLSCVDGFNVPMKVVAPDGTRLQALNAKAPDAYLWDKDDTKTHGLQQEGKFTVTFER